MGAGRGAGEASAGRTRRARSSACPGDALRSERPGQGKEGGKTQSHSGPGGRSQGDTAGLPAGTGTGKAEPGVSPWAEWGRVSVTAGARRAACTAAGRDRRCSLLTLRGPAAISSASTPGPWAGESG